MKVKDRKRMENGRRKVSKEVKERHKLCATVMNK